MPSFARRVVPYTTTIFAEINTLAQQHNAVNLGQGRPDFDGPAEVIEAAIAAMRDGRANQYAPGYGIAALRQAVADHARRFYGLNVDPEQGVIVTVGAAEGMFSSILGLIDPGDEVILIEPYFDTYLPAVEMAGGVPRFVPLRPPDWTFDEAEMRTAFNDKTRAIILNTPHNPTGRVFTRAELSLIAELCQKYDVIAISDEVYEHLVFGDHQHVPIATLDGMAERTVTVSSGAKSFSYTGWKVGWAMGHPDLITGTWRIHQNILYAVNHPAQYGIAHALGLDDEYFAAFRRLYEGKRRLLDSILRESGFTVSQAQGTFFIMADFSAFFEGDDMQFTRWLIQQVGVACIPPAESFFSPQHRHLGRKHVRFSFCKNDDVLLAAGERLSTLKAKL